MASQKIEFSGIRLSGGFQLNSLTYLTTKNLMLKKIVFCLLHL